MTQPALVRSICRDIGGGVGIFKVPARPTPCSYPGPSRVLPWKYTPGPNVPGGCVEHALSIALELPRDRVVRELELAHLLSIGFRVTPVSDGWPTVATDYLLSRLGWIKTSIRGLSDPCRVHLHDLPTDRRLIVGLESHMTVLDHGVVVDKLNASDPDFGVRGCCLNTWEKP